MAVKECSAIEKALQQIKEKVACAICLESCTQAKLLKCFHVYCMKCVQLLAREGPEGQSVTCPHCRQTTVLPPSGVSGLQGAFYIEHLLEIQDTLQKVNSSDKTQCEKCKKREAASFCRICGFVCQLCQQMHQEWEDFSSHEVISLATLTEDVTAMVPPLKKTVFCSKHLEKEADLYCDTCDELICRDCIIIDHSKHDYNFVEESFEKHKVVIESGLKSVEEQVITMGKARKDVHTRRDSLLDQKKAMEADVCSDIDHLKQALDTRRAEIIGEMGKLFDTKLASLEKQDEEIETREKQLRDCSSCVRQSLCTGNQKEILSIKKSVVKEMAELTGSLEEKLLVPVEQADLHYERSDPSVTKACKEVGKVHHLVVCPEQCVASGAGVKAAVVGEASSVCVQTVDWEGKAVGDLQIAGELVSSDGQDHIRARVKKGEDKVYELTYQPQHRGQHQLHITVEDCTILNSPFSVTVLPNLTAPTSVIGDLHEPWGIAVREGGDIVVAEYGSHRITTISASGKKKSFGTHGSTPGQLSHPNGIAIDSNGNIIVADSGNHRIQQFSSTGKFIKAVGTHGKEDLQFDHPTGIAISSQTKKIYVVDSDNGRIQILNSNLTYHSSFGRNGSNNGEFNQPFDIAIHGEGHIYVADLGNHRIQVFTQDGAYVRQFGSSGWGYGILKSPSAIAIDSNNIVYVTDLGNHCVSVFTSDGENIKMARSSISLQTIAKQLLRPFVEREPAPFTSCGITVDKDGTIYVCDTYNDCLKTF